MKEITCNICGSGEYKVLHRGLKVGEETPVAMRYASSSNIIGNDQIVQCKQCQLQYVNPQLEPEKIIKGYSEGSDEAFVSQAKGREITFGKCLQKVEKATKGQKGKILDIGTAGGSFLKVAKERGWDVYGIEPNKWLCNWCKENYGITIEQGVLETTKFKEGTFDVITLWDVLEHVPDPADTLTRCRMLLKEGGLLVVNYPDIGSLPAKVMGWKWVFILSVHLWYFTPKTITKLFEKVGFAPVVFKKHWQTLGLGYLIKRTKEYSVFAHHVGRVFANTLRLNNLQIPYWLGQTLVIVRKK